MRGVRCARRFRRLRLQPDRQIFISSSSSLIVFISALLNRVHPLFSIYLVSLKFVFNGNRDAEEKRNVLEEKGSLKSYQLLYPGVPGTAPLAAAAASLCFLFTRKLWKSQNFISHFTLFTRNRIQKNIDFKTLYIYIFIFFFIILSFDISRISPLRRWKLSTHANGIIRDTKYGVFDPPLEYTWSRCFTSVEAIALWSCLSFFLNASSLSFSLLCSSSCFCCSQSCDKKRGKQRNVNVNVENGG